MDLVWLLFRFRGRINRAKYLIVELALLALWLLLWFKPWFQAAPLWEHWVAAISMIWINLAVTTKRLHDRNRNGWWAVAVFVVNRLSWAYYSAFFGLSFGADIPVASELLLLVLVAVALSLLQTWVMIELFFLVGTDGPNRFGPDPTRIIALSPTGPRADPDRVPDFLLHPH